MASLKRVQGPETLPRQRAQRRLRRPPRPTEAELARRETRSYEAATILFARIPAERRSKAGSWKIKETASASVRSSRPCPMVGHGQPLRHLGRKDGIHAAEATHHFRREYSFLQTQ